MKPSLSFLLSTATAGLLSMSLVHAEPMPITQNCGAVPVIPPMQLPMPMPGHDVGTPPPHAHDDNDFMHMTRDLDLSDEQLAKIKTIQASHQAERENLHQQEHDIDHKVMDEVFAILTPEQQALVKARKELHKAELTLRIQQLQSELKKLGSN